MSDSGHMANQASMHYHTRLLAICTLVILLYTKLLKVQEIRALKLNTLQKSLNFKVTPIFQKLPL